MPLENGALVELTKSIYATIQRVGDQLSARISALEKREPVTVSGIDGKDGKDGKDAVVDYVKLVEEIAATSVVHDNLAPRVEEYAKAFLEAHQPENGIDGKDGQIGDRGPQGEKGEKGDPGPAGEKGVDGLNGERGPQGERGEKGEPGLVGKDGADGLPGDRGERGERGEKGEPGLDGKDAPHVTKELIIEALTAYPVLLSEAVQKHFEANPIRDGKDGAQGERGADGVNGKDGRDGKDGLSIVEAMIDNEGVLVHTFSDGTVKRLSRVVGKDGTHGEKGDRGDNGFDGLNGKDGMNGLDGRDGVTTLGDDVEFVRDGRTINVVREGKVIGGWKSTEMIYRNVWKSDESYEQGDVVTWGGSSWHCNEATTDKPGTGSSAWTLCVKRGQDGKQGPQGERGPQGLIGPQGPNRY